ncbi:hypothetical protein [Bradyrhizobium sp. LB11.1]|uniref:hypothetical protein n=1 Tax=Bradyrhizobium sp. LB11.1 TaxID=3156326 RepID=UPI0033920416
MTIDRIDNSGARRSRNKKNAFQFAQVGLYVFPSDGKVPLNVHLVAAKQMVDDSRLQIDFDVIVKVDLGFSPVFGRNAFWSCEPREGVFSVERAERLLARQVGLDADCQHALYQRTR